MGLLSSGLVRVRLRTALALLAPIVPRSMAVFILPPISPIWLVVRSSKNGPSAFVAVFKILFSVSARFTKLKRISMTIFIFFASCLSMNFVAIAFASAVLVAVSMLYFCIASILYHVVIAIVTIGIVFAICSPLLPSLAVVFALVVILVAIIVVVFIVNFFPLIPISFVVVGIVAAIIVVVVVVPIATPPSPPPPP